MRCPCSPTASWPPRHVIGPPNLSDYCSRTHKAHIIKYLTINLGQKLVDDRIVDASIAADGASRFADGVDLVKYYDVETTVWAALEL